MAAGLLIGSCLTGCRPSPSASVPKAPTAPVRIRQDHQDVYHRTQQRWSRAVFLSPQPETSQGEDRWMAPLIVQELDDGLSGDAAAAGTSTSPSQAPPGFGRLSIDASGQVKIAVGAPTVYRVEGKVEIDGRSFSQWTFAWFYPPASAAPRVPYRGFRMTRDRHGYALICEVISSDAGRREFYVAKSVEQAAARKFGRPLAGRRYHVEPSLSEQPDVLVPRIVGEGPQPMGPFVYLDRQRRQVTTLLCRCEPSQVETFAKSSTYELICLPGWEKLWAPHRAPADLYLPAVTASPDACLRLPAE
jgi:hypothetical protein